MLLDEVQTCFLGSFHDEARRHALFGIRTGSTFARQVVDDSNATVRLQGPRDILQQRYRLLHLMKRVNDEHRVRTRNGRQSRVVVFVTFV